MLKNRIILIFTAFAFGTALAGELSLKDYLLQLGHDKAAVRSEAGKGLLRILKNNEKQYLELLATVDLEKDASAIEVSKKKLLRTLEEYEKVMKTTRDPEVKASLTKILSQVSPSKVFEEPIEIQTRYVVDTKISPNWRFKAINKDDKIEGCILANMYHYPQDRWSPSEGKTAKALVIEIGDLRLIFLNYKNNDFLDWGRVRIALNSSQSFSRTINKDTVKIDNYMYGDDYCSINILNVPFKVDNSVLTINRKENGNAEQAVSIRISYPKKVLTATKPGTQVDTISEVVEKLFIPCDIKNVLVFSHKGAFLTHIVPPPTKKMASTDYNQD